MSISRNNKHIESFKSFIIGKTIECLEGRNRSIYDHPHVVEEIGKFVVVCVDVPQAFYQFLSLNFVDAIVIAECKRRNRPIPQAVVLLPFSSVRYMQNERERKMEIRKINLI